MFTVKFNCCFSSFPVGGEPASDLHVDDGGAAGVQPQRKPQRSNVLGLPALPGSGQPGPQLELPAAKSYPFIVSDRLALPTCPKTDPSLM